MAASEVAAYCASADYSGLAQYCENFELDLRHTDVDLTASVGIYQVHLAAYLLQGELDRARFLWKRLPNEVKADTELQAMWAVGKAMWQQKHAEVHAKAAAFAWSDPFVALQAETRASGGAAATPTVWGRGPSALGCSAQRGQKRRSAVPHPRPPWDTAASGLGLLHTTLLSPQRAACVPTSNLAHVAASRHGRWRR